MNIKDLIMDNTVTFDSYRQGFFYYRISDRNSIIWSEPVNGRSVGIHQDVYTFPVPIDDIGSATLLKEDKAITFMRWIRKAIDEGTLNKVNGIQKEAKE